jgi:hypothetical protein
MGRPAAFWSVISLIVFALMKALDRQCPQSGVGVVTNKFVLKCNVLDS